MYSSVRFDPRLFYKKTKFGPRDSENFPLIVGGIYYDPNNGPRGLERRITRISFDGKNGTIEYEAESCSGEINFNDLFDGLQKDFQYRGFKLNV